VDGASYYARRSARDPEWRDAQIREAMERQRIRREEDPEGVRDERRRAARKTRARQRETGLTFHELASRAAVQHSETGPRTLARRCFVTRSAADPLADQITSLPESVQRRMWAIGEASKHLSLMKPRMYSEEAVDEVIALAEEILDQSYGGRQARLEAMPYREYLKTPEWDEKRRAAYRRANYRCQLCNASGVQLHAHHRSYEKRSKEGEEEDLIVLCATCHERVHAFIWSVE
jgi:hypothetical protein